MRGTPLFGGSQPTAPPVDSTEALQRIERNTADISRWIKILTVMVIILILVTLVVI